tara:strand:+ start:570 stop:1439 length:870 start_codon:yes stop_codon:yes gene_type:complete
MKNTSIFLHKSKKLENNFLYLVGTPIGNLDDISFRALKILKNVSLIACEDTRQTKKLLNKYKFKNKLISFNKHNSLKKIPIIINKVKDGNSVALVSDAGLPSICDPGENLVKEAKSQGLNVVCVPGPSAALTALISSGLPSSKFIFEGFLPRKKKEREKILLEISEVEKTTILFESPHRLKKLLKDLKDFCGGDREIQVFRELTKIYEENVGQNIDMAIDFFEGKEVIGEITIVIKGTDKKNIFEFDDVYLKKELKELINAGLSLSSASKYLAKKTNIAKSMIYNLYKN